MKDAIADKIKVKTSKNDTKPVEPEKKEEKPLLKVNITAKAGENTTRKELKKALEEKKEAVPVEAPKKDLQHIIQQVIIPPNFMKDMPMPSAQPSNAALQA